MNCEKCGCILENDVKFCKNCGAAVWPGTAAPTPDSFFKPAGFGAPESHPNKDHHKPSDRMSTDGGLRISPSLQKGGPAENITSDPVLPPPEQIRATEQYGSGLSAELLTGRQKKPTETMKEKKKANLKLAAIIGGTAVLLVALALVVFFTTSSPSVIKEIYTGTEYCTEAENKEYVENLLGPYLYLYENDSELAYYHLRDDDMEVSYLERTVRFSDGSDVTLPCSYLDIKNKGWSSEEKESKTDVYLNNIFCRKENGWRACFGRPSEDIKPTIRDSKIESVEISTGDFAKKDDYVLITTRNPEFTYMGIDRDSTPSQVIQKIGFPDSIEYHVNLTFEYTLYDSTADKWLRVQFCWLKLKDGPEIMRDFRILYSDSYKLLW